MNPGDAQRLFGTDEPVAAERWLRAGSLTARLRGGRLGPICFAGREVWHGVDFLFRDQDWGTPLPALEVLEQEEDAAGFRLRLRGHIAPAGLDLELLIRGEARTLCYAATATARRTVATNRTGLVLLHPLAACGRRVEVTHADGRSSASTFPTLIAPWPPFALVRGLRHEYAPGAWACCEFEGDDFELEDQRNNADASFKTYNRSNLMPRPYYLRAGTQVRQAVQLRIESAPERPVRPRARTVQVALGAAQGPLPAIGTAVAAADGSAGASARQALRALAPAYLHLVLESVHEPLDAVALAGLLADAGGCPLRLDVGGPPAPQEDAGELARLAAKLRDAQVRPASVAVFPSTPPAVAAARRAFPEARLGAGTPHFFTQLNRAEDLASADFLSFTTASVVHGCDEEEILAGLRSLPAMVATLRARHGSVPVHVGPSSIGARRSPLGGQPLSDGSRRVALARRDPRTRGLFGAAWALGYVAQLTEAGARAITLFDLQGDAALLDGAATTPAFELLRHLTGPATWRQVTVSQPQAVAVLALQRQEGSCVLLANLRAEPVDVAVEGLGRPGPVQLLDVEALRRRTADPRAGAWRVADGDAGAFRLPAHAVALI